MTIPGTASWRRRCCGTPPPVCRGFVEAMGVYGVPEEVLTDNGTVFTGRFIRPCLAEVLFERNCRETASPSG